MTVINTNMDEFQKRYATWKKPNTEGCILYDFVYVKIFFKSQNYNFRKNIRIGQI